jgi:hypothetical protein
MTSNMTSNLNDMRNTSRSDAINGNSSSDDNLEINASISTAISKIVNIDNNNVVFKVLKTDIPDIYNLYCTDDKENLIKNSIALVPNIKISHFLYNAFCAKPNNLGMNMECKFSKIFEKWIPIRFVDNNIYSKKKIDEIEETLKFKE